LAGVSPAVGPVLIRQTLDEIKMDIREDIKTLFREIEVYRSHSLFEEARGKCRRLEKLIRENDQIKNKQELLQIVAEKIKGLEEDARRVGEETASAQMSKREQALVKKLFAVPKKGDDASTAMEGAIALLVFGQFRKALDEFNVLIENDALRVAAAKNVVRCHVGLSSLNDAVEQYEQWFSSGRFSPQEIENIRSFLQDILEKKGVDKVLSKPEKAPTAEVKTRPKPEVEAAAADSPRTEKGDTAPVQNEMPAEGEFIDILNIQLPINKELGAGEDSLLDVGYQKGNLISVIIPRESKLRVEKFTAGLRIDDVQFFSPAVVFRSPCVISDINKIDTGPRKGGVALILKILSA